jgi:Tol biopolymer transport system component
LKIGYEEGPRGWLDNISPRRRSGLVPDGTKIAFQSARDGNNEIYTMNADGTGVKRLTNNSARDEDPVYSPSGKHLAFFRDRDGDLEIFRMTSTDTTQTQLTFNDAAQDVRPSWQPLR